MLYITKDTIHVALAAADVSRHKTTMLLTIRASLTNQKLMQVQVKQLKSCFSSSMRRRRLTEVGPLINFNLACFLSNKISISTFHVILSFNDHENPYICICFVLLSLLKKKKISSSMIRLPFLYFFQIIFT